jgi:hypothetical protein
MGNPLQSSLTLQNEESGSEANAKNFFVPDLQIFVLS